MKKRFDRARKWLGSNGSAIIAVSSLCIAIFSLYFTIKAQEVDRQYKELSIQPRLNFYSHAGDFRLTLRNTGPGHARIHRMITKFEGKCSILLSNEAQREADAFRQKIFLDISKSFEKIISNVSKQAKEKRAYFLRHGIPYSGTIIAPNAEVLIFEVAGEDTKFLFSEIARLRVSSKESNEFNEFVYAMTTLPIGIEFCSLTGIYCSFALADSSVLSCLESDSI